MKQLAIGTQRKGRTAGVKSIKRKPNATVYSPQAIGHIIKAVGGKEPDSRQQLAADLFGVDADFVDIIFWRNESKGPTREKVRRIHKALEDIAQEIETDPYLKPQLDTSRLRDFAKSVWAIVLMQRLRVDNRRRRRAQEGYHSIPPIAFLVSDLREVYEARFASRAAKAWRNDQPCGEVIDFIEAVLKEILESPCNRTTIVRAFTPGK